MIACALAAMAAPAAACRLALVLALDVSSSVDATEDALQRQGLAQALLAQEVQEAFFATDLPVALAVFEWSGRYNQLLVQDWILVDAPNTLAAISSRIATTPRSQTDYPTALGHALGYASVILRRAPVCDQHTVDVSGDGPNNDGFAPRDAYGAFEFNDVTVNGLVINATVDGASPAQTNALVDYYQQEVLHGSGAFVEVADGFEDFQATMERKLIRELGVRIIGQHVPDR